MFQVLHQYLVAKRQLTLPGIGSWQLREEPAKYEHTTQQLIPRKVVVDFTQDHDHVNGMQPLMGYLAKTTGEPEEDCFENLNAFTEKIKLSLDSTGSFDWPRLGTLQIGQDNRILFEPEPALENYTPAIHAPRIVHEGKVHQMLVGDQETDSGTMQNYLHEAEMTETEETTEPKKLWWIPALIGGIIGLVLIVARLNKWW